MSLRGAIRAAVTGNHIWAEKYDRPLADIFDVQDDITRSVAASTQTHVALAEGTRAEQAPEVNAWLLIKRAWRRHYDLTAGALAEARELAERAVELAPESGLAYEVLASVLAHQVFICTVVDAADTLAKARDAASKATRLRGSEYA